MPDPDSPDTPTTLILYGATGDLAKRMVLPAIYELFSRGLLPKAFHLVGNGRGDVAHEDFRKRIRESLTEFAPEADLTRFDDFAKQASFAGGGFQKSDPGSLLDVIAEADEELGGKPALIHYLAVPPSAFAPITEAIKEHGLAENAKAVYEKPYGTSMESFRELDELVHSTFEEEQVYRIDHFLGKEATQNLHLVRFANRLFGDAWSAEHLAQVQIDVPEDLDIDDRAEFYDATGAALDMLVTHLFQVAAEVAMEPPLSMAADDLLSAREAVISAFRPLDTDEVVLGQYQTYRQTEGIAPDSTTDTYVAARLWIDTDRWQRVPFLLRTGKKMAASAQRVSLIFKPAEGPLHSTGRYPDVLTFDLKGNGAIEIEMTVKKPGPESEPAEGSTRLNLENVAEGAMAPYTSLIYDVLAGDRSLFTSSAGLAAAFRAFQPLLDHPPAVEIYADDSWGPTAADRLTDGLGWRLG
jgi:glucose-6-phosphate 1-dehydrogenase